MAHKKIHKCQNCVALLVRDEPQCDQLTPSVAILNHQCIEWHAHIVQFVGGNSGDFSLHFLHITTLVVECPQFITIARHDVDLGSLRISLTRVCRMRPPTGADVMVAVMLCTTLPVLSCRCRCRSFLFAFMASICFEVSIGGKHPSNCLLVHRTNIVQRPAWQF